MSDLQKPYSLHQRILKKGVFWYAQFRLPNGRWSTPKNTGQADRRKAEAWCIAHLSGGQLVERAGVSFQEYAENFFAWSGRWALRKRALGRSLSERHARERGDIVRNHLVPYFGVTKIAAINEPTIDDLRIHLYGKGLAAGTRNKILIALRTILQAAHDEKLIRIVPKIELVTPQEKRRGRLTADEARRLFSVPWADTRARLACLISATTGARLSEVQALRVQDIDLEAGIVHIRRAWDKRCRYIKETTKSKRSRVAPIPLPVLHEIQRHIETMPKGEELLIYSTKIPRKPAEDGVITGAFLRALAEIGIDDATRRERGICFHSFRYLANSLLVEAAVPTAKIHEVIGHADDRLTERYFRSEDHADVRAAITSALFQDDDGGPVH